MTQRAVDGGILPARGPGRRIIMVHTDFVVAEISVRPYRKLFVCVLKKEKSGSEYSLNIEFNVDNKIVGCSLVKSVI